MTPLYHRLYRVLFAFEDRLDASAVEVSHPSFDSSVPRCLACVGAVVDTLYLSGDEDVRSFHTGDASA